MFDRSWIRLWFTLDCFKYVDNYNFEVKTTITDKYDLEVTETSSKIRYLF